MRISSNVFLIVAASMLAGGFLGVRFITGSSTVSAEHLGVQSAPARDVITPYEFVSLIQSGHTMELSARLRAGCPVAATLTDESSKVSVPAGATTLLHQAEAKQCHPSCIEIVELMYGCKRAPLNQCVEAYYRSSRYLIFERVGTHWRLLGVHEHDLAISRHYPPSVRIVKFNDEPAWLVIHAGGGAGTGVGMYREDWISLRACPGTVALSLTTGSWNVRPTSAAGNAGPRMLMSHQGEQVIVTSLQHSQWWEGSDDYPKPARFEEFVRSGLAVFRFSEDLCQFVLDESSSDWTSAELPRIGWSDDLSVPSRVFPTANNFCILSLEQHEYRGQSSGL